MMKTLDLSTIPSTSSSRTVSLVNSFVISTSQFLNKFSFLCEKKLSEVSRDIQRLEITMNLLEAKLSSIPGLDGVTSNVSSATDAPSQNHVRFAEEPSFSEMGGPPPPPPPPGTFSSNAVPVESNDSVVKVKDDPEYAQWFQKLKVGVPEQVVRNRMELAGLDPDLLMTPDAPLPASRAKKDVKTDQTSSDEESEEEPEFESLTIAPPPPKSKVTENEESGSPILSFSVPPPPPVPFTLPPPPPPSIPSVSQEDDDDDDDDDDEDEPSGNSAPPFSPPPFLPPPTQRISASDDDDDDDDDDE